jgi:hypothetical protein
MATKGTPQSDRRVVLVRVTGFQNRGKNVKYTSYEIEFRFNDNKKMTVEKRYRGLRNISIRKEKRYLCFQFMNSEIYFVFYSLSDFRSLWQHAANNCEDLKDFDFPVKTKTVNDLVKENRLRKFDELMKLWYDK